MKLLFSSLLFSLASASELVKQNERGLSNPTEAFADAGALFSRWDMSEPEIDYDDTTDTFEFVFMDASELNSDDTIEESFWNSDCMPAVSGVTGHQLPGTLVYEPGNKGTLPRFAMEATEDDSGNSIGNRPTMRFQIDPAKIMSYVSSANVPNLYSGEEPSCDTKEQPWSILRKNYRCPTVWLADGVTLDTDPSPDTGTVFQYYSPSMTLDDCLQSCSLDEDCDLFTTEDGWCTGCTKEAILEPATDEVDKSPDVIEVCDQSGDPGDQPPPGNSRIDFCVRTSLGYLKEADDSNDVDNADSMLNANFQEVNFIETLVRIEYNMAAGFSVDSFSVAPKNRELFTVSEDYTAALEAFLCIGPNHPEYDVNDDVGYYLNYEQDDEFYYTMPPKLTDYNASGGTKKFNQGALINVCVKVKTDYAEQGLRLQKLTEFKWTRTGSSTFDRSIGGGDGDTTIEQMAIEDSLPATNYLSSYTASNCLNKVWCDFASILFAQFYNTDGTVSGTGDAILQFDDGTRRNLRDGDSRKLQEEPGGAGMDVSIDVNGNAEGPGDLKTAGGASIGAGAVASVAAFIGAVLLA